MREPRSRRNFLGAMSAAGAAIGFVPKTAAAREDEAPAILGGKPVRDRPFPGWPVIGENDEKAWKDVLHKKRWCRLGGDYANQFEAAWARILGAKHCLAVANGTSALDHVAGGPGRRAR